MEKLNFQSLSVKMIYGLVTLEAIHMHIDSEDKEEMLELLYKEGAQNGHPFRNVQ